MSQKGIMSIVTLYKVAPNPGRTRPLAETSRLIDIDKFPKNSDPGKFLTARNPEIPAVELPVVYPSRGVADFEKLMRGGIFGASMMRRRMWEPSKSTSWHETSIESRCSRQALCSLASE